MFEEKESNMDAQEIRSFNNWTLAIALGLVSAWIAYSDGILAMIKYVAILGSVAANGWLFSFFGRGFFDHRTKLLLVTLLAASLNILVGYIVFPKIGLVLALWLPGIAGFIFRSRVN